MADKIPPRERPARTRLHTEEHVPGGVSVRDVILGGSDGRTGPFALAAGLRGAATLAGGIVMALGGYLSEKSHAEIYRKELERKHREVDEVPDIERREVRDIWQARGYSGAELDQRVDAIITAATAGRSS